MVVGRKPRTCKLSSVLYVPELGYNLLSVSSMDKNGNYTTFGGNKCKIMNKKSLLATGSLIRKLYTLDIPQGATTSPTAFIAQSLQQWHENLAHINPQVIKSMSSEGPATGINIVDSTKTPPSCEHCITGKGHRYPFPKTSTSQTARLLELVNSDVNGPMEVPSLGGSRYFITFIDDFSKWTLVYIMKRKSESFKSFQLFHKISETHIATKITTVNTLLRTTNRLIKLRSGATITVRSMFQMNLRIIWRRMELHIKPLLHTPRNKTAKRSEWTEPYLILLNISVRSLRYSNSIESKFTTWKYRNITRVYACISR